MQGSTGDSSDEFSISPHDPVRVEPGSVDAVASSSPLGAPSGERIVGGKYELLRELGRGSTGVVHEARSLWTHRLVALKRLHPLPTTSDERRFVREARTAARLVHPNVVDVLDMGKDVDGTLYIVFELLDGIALDRVIAQRAPLKLAEAVSIFLPLADALALAHEHGIVHRDVKPSNVVLARGPRGRTVAKLVDFGIARDLASEDGLRVTMDGLMGTPFYMAPEQIVQGEEIDGRADVWGLAVCLFEALTGTLPFRSRKMHDLCREILELDCPRASERAFNLGPAVDGVLRRALTPDRSARTQTMRAFQADLLALREEARPTERPPPPSSPAPASGSDEEAEPSETLPDVVAHARAAKAKPLRLGVVWTAPQSDRDATANALMAALGRGVQVLRFGSYAELVDAVLERDLDLGWLPPVAYVRARRATDMRLLVSAVRHGGTTYRSALLGRRGVVDRIEGARGRRAAWVDGWSAAGYLVPRAMLVSAGISPDRDLTAQGFLGSHDAVLEALTHGTADLGATYCRFDEAGSLTGPWLADTTSASLSVLAISEPIPGDVLCAGPGVPFAEAEAMAILIRGASQSIAPMIGAKDLESIDASAYDALERALVDG